jgi:hypothetical protein
MPRNPIDYSKALIYKIEHLKKPELCYVGSTSNFVKRKATHKNACNDEKSKEYNQLKYRTMRENGGWEHFKMVVIKEYPCNTRTELDIEEEKCRKELQAILNSHRCHITDEERKEQNKENKKKYYEEHKEQLKDYNKEYHDNNKETIAENKKKYYEEHKEIILEKNKEYRDNNKEKITERDKKKYEANKEIISEKKKEKMTCVCGSTFRICAKSRHEKSKKHCDFIK